MLKLSYICVLNRFNFFYNQGSTSTHPQGVSASLSTPPSAARNISEGDCGSGHNITPPP
jgi:hypothetical protein